MSALSEIVNERLAVEEAPYNQYRMDDNIYRNPALPLIVVENVSTGAKLEIGISYEDVEAPNVGDMKVIHLMYTKIKNTIDSFEKSQL